MPNVLFVTLDHDINPTCLDIDEHGNPNHVKRDPHRQTIRWKLSGNASTGSFDTQTNSKPGFAWIPNGPSPGIFGEPVLQANSKELTVTDLNDSDNTVGSWVYQLSATIDHVTYQSKTITVERTTTNPRIKNT